MQDQIVVNVDILVYEFCLKQKQLWLLPEVGLMCVKSN